jgi:Domain of unknown function (DUF4397)
MNRNPLRSSLASLLLVASLLLGITSCGSSGSRVRFVSADFTYQGNVDILIDNRVINTNIAYGAGTSYQGISSGARKLEVRPTGSTSSGTDYVNTTLNVQGSSDTTVVLDFSGGSVATPFTDKNSAPSSGILIRAIHAASFLGPLDVYMIQQNQGISGLSPQFPNVAFNTATNKYAPLQDGSWEVVFTSSGTQGIVRDTGTTIPTLSTGSIRTVVAVNTLNGSPGYIVLTDR